MLHKLHNRIPGAQSLSCAMWRPLSSGCHGLSHASSRVLPTRAFLSTSSPCQNSIDDIDANFAFGTPAKDHANAVAKVKSILDNWRSESSGSASLAPGALDHLPQDISQMVRKDLPDALKKTVPLPKTHGVLVGRIELSAYRPDITFLQLFSSFALRSAKAMGIPTSPIHFLPRKTQRYVMPKGPFAHTKTKQVWQRQTLSRAIDVYDANEPVLEAWLGYLRANVLPQHVSIKATLYSYTEPASIFKPRGRMIDSSELHAAATDISEKGTSQTKA